MDSGQMVLAQVMFSHALAFLPGEEMIWFTEGE